MGCFSSKKQEFIIEDQQRQQSIQNGIQGAHYQANILQEQQNNYVNNFKKEAAQKKNQKNNKQKINAYINYLLYKLEYVQDLNFLFTNIQNQMYQKFIQQEFDQLLLDQKEINVDVSNIIKQKYNLNQQNSLVQNENKNIMINLFKSEKINYASSMFFKIGAVKMYSEDILILNKAGNENKQEYIWNPLESPKENLQRELNIPDNVFIILSNKQLFEISMKYGRFIIHKQRWGYLMDIYGCQSFYQGVLDNDWEKLLLTEYFQYIIKRYASFMLEKDEDELFLRKIPTSHDDPAVNPLIVTVYDILFEHQKKEVGWMSSLEFNPFLTFNNDLEYIPLLDTGFYFHPKYPKKLLKKHELKQKQYYMPGGVLASEIGSGKTISVIALTTIGSQLQDPSFKQCWDQYRNIDPDALLLMSAGDRYDLESKAQVYDRLNISYDGVYLPSLIIVTKNILYQWSNEYKQFASNLRVFVVESWENIVNLEVIEVEGSLTKKKYRIFKDYDIILTHRSVIQVAQLEYPKLPQLFDIHFNRIVYDEMHEISTILSTQREKDSEEQKNSDLDEQETFFRKHINDFFMAIQKIKRRFSWGITGTPDNLNFSNDSFPMVFLLNLCNDYYNLNQYNILQDKFILCNMRSNPKSVNLPPLNKNITEIFMKQIQNLLVQGKARSNSKDEQQAREMLSHFSKQYDFLEELDEKLYPEAINMIREMQNIQMKQVKEQINKENNASKKNLLKMREEQLMSEDNFYQDIIKIIKNPKFSCNICYEDCERDKLVVTQCLHNFCYSCFESLCKHLAIPDCPFCNQQISKQQVIIHPDLAQKSDSKLDKLISSFCKLPQDDKIIIFTQFHDLTKKLSEKLSQIDIPHVLLLGEPSEVNIRLHTFKTVPEVRILIMSIEQAASGINLAEANHIYFMHPIFGMNYEKSRSVYAQCIGRALRVGQGKPVTATLYATKNSLEITLSAQFQQKLNV